MELQTGSGTGEVGCMVGEVDTQGMVGKQEGRTAATLVLASVRLGPVIDSGSQCAFAPCPKYTTGSTSYL
jgi:hypothetical protein